MPLKDSEKYAAYMRDYRANRQTAEQSSRYRSRIKARVKEQVKWFREYKATLSCIRCPENDPVCLDFHHRDPDAKEMMVSQVAYRGWSKKRILAEIAKCDVLCANCHRKEHAKHAR